jgi:hypothetical protein
MIRNVLAAIGVAVALQTFITPVPTTQTIMIGSSPPGTCAVGAVFSNSTTGAVLSCTATNTWTSVGGNTGGLPSGAIVLIDSGACPAGTGEVAGLDGVLPLGTVAANGNIGTTGGANTITPAGSNSAPAFTGDSVSTNSVSGGTPAGTNSAPALTMNSYTPAGTNTAPAFTGSGWTPPVISWPAGVPSFSGTPFSSVINHTHAINPAWLVQGGTTAATTGTHIMTSTATGGSTRTPTTGDSIAATSSNPVGGVASITPAGTVAWPAGVPTIAAYTPAGTVAAPTFSGTGATLTGSVAAPTFTGSALGTHSHTVTATGSVAAPTFTGTQFDNRSAFKRVIYCKAT